ncbi:C40 family peptidase [Hymenobacter actinosclerus]|uniref:Cell wall-associated hydrolase, NlpC family n=1 Tax=Hymenobacter actinosclerus TaxID=82805 RepID=A0A1I0ECN2_9BACT|nr:C40 family peptidase [Hymenobacter actinosclerus]SET42515.1 Cell wall-associated hydrolase, NlpC family [Hymenobacter actinosclerus]
MRYVWSVFLLLIALLVGRAAWVRLRAPAPPTRTTEVALLTPTRPTAYRTTAPPARRPRVGVSTASSAARHEPAPQPTPVPGLGAAAPTSKADSIVAFALRQLGTPYVYAGVSPKLGFDCSGFVMYVFARYGVPTPHSTAMLIDVGRPVARATARPGDIVVFTGTAATSTTPGHAGIVISAPGEPIRFVHASSARRESGVKISQVEGTDYERRFMQVRRVL